MSKRLALLFLLIPLIGAQISVENSAPIFDPLEDKFIEQKPFIYYLEATDREGSSLTFSSNSDLFQVEGASKTEGIIQVLPSIENIGIHNINFEVSDGELSDSKDATFIILPHKYSTKFSIDKSSIDFSGDSIKTLEITNLEEDPLYLLIDSPEFMKTLSSMQVNYVRELVLQTDSTENMFGVMTISSPKAVIDIPIFSIMTVDSEVDIMLTEVKGLAIGRDTEIKYSLTRNNAENAVIKDFTANLYSREGQVLATKVIDIPLNGTEYEGILTLSIPSGLEEGTYGLILTLDQEGKTSTAYRTIELMKGIPGIPLAALNYAIIVAAIFLFFKLIKHNRHHLKKIHKVHKKHSLFLKNQRISKTKENRLREKLATLNQAYALGSVTKKNYDRAKSHFLSKIRRAKRDQDKV